MVEMDGTDSIIEQNILASIFLVIIRQYLSILDLWWSEGEITDWVNEFVIEKRYAIKVY